LARREQRSTFGCRVVRRARQHQERKRSCSSTSHATPLLADPLTVLDAFAQTTGSVSAIRRARPAEDFDPDAVGIECKERVIVFAVVDVVLVGRRLDRAASGDARSVRLVDLVSIVHLEGEVLDPHFVVPVGTAVRRAQPEPLYAVLEVDDLFGLSIGGVPELLLEPERPENPGLIPGVCVDIPLGTAFQYRCTGNVPLVFTCMALPSWPGDAEAVIVDGPWVPRVDPKPGGRRSD
jgi:hypothetical protein